MPCEAPVMTATFLSLFMLVSFRACVRAHEASVYTPQHIETAEAGLACRAPTWRRVQKAVGEGDC